MRTILVTAMILAAGSASAQAPKTLAKPVLVKAVEAASARDTREPSQRFKAQQEAIKALSFLDGEWRGTSKILRKTGWTPSVQTERVGTMLEGTVKVIEVRGYEADGRLGFNALRMISYEPESKAYIMRSYQGGSARDYPVEATATGLSWQIQTRDDGTIRYETSVKNGVWTETATRIPAKGEKETYLTISMKRARATTWPEGGALLAK
jgi:hypothetical protein